MNRIFILLLLAIMLLQTFSKVLLIVDYQANKEYIMEFLCINRDKPDLECEGKCHLTKELKKQEATEKQGGEKSLAQDVSITLFCQQVYTFSPAKSVPSQVILPTLPTGSVQLVFQTIFHPPQSIVS